MYNRPYHCNQAWLRGFGAMSTSLSAMTALALILSAAQVSAFRLMGRIEGLNGEPIPAATLTVRAEGKILVDHSPVVAGRFSLEIETNAQSITCVFEAKRFHTRTVTLDVTGATTRTEAIKLKPVKGLALGAMTHHLAPGAREETIEFVVTNENREQALHLASVTISGSKLRKTDCFDVDSPGIVFRFPHGAQLRREADGPVELRVAVGGGESSISARGRAEFLQCDQRRLSLRINYEVVLGAGKSEKILLAIPAIPAGTDGEPKLLELGIWERLVLSVTESDGRVTKTSEIRSDLK